METDSFLTSGELQILALRPWIQFSATEAAPKCDSSTWSPLNLHSFWKVKDGKTISWSVKMQILLVPQSNEMARYFSMRLHTQGGSRWLGPFFLNSLWFVRISALFPHKIINQNQLSAKTVWLNYNISWQSCLISKCVSACALPRVDEQIPRKEILLRKWLLSTKGYTMTKLNTGVRRADFLWFRISHVMPNTTNITWGLESKRVDTTEFPLRLKSSQILKRTFFLTSFQDRSLQYFFMLMGKGH